MSVRRGTLVAAASLAVVTSAGAQIPLGTEIRVQSNPVQVPWQGGGSRVAAHLPDGGFVVAWTPYLPGGPNIAARRFDAAGHPVAGEILVNTHTTGVQDHPAIASDSAGNFVVVWSSDGQDGSGTGIFGQRFDASGARVGAEFQANETTAGAQRSPSVAASDGGFVVVWTGPSGDGVRGRRYDAAGAPVGGEFQVNTYTTGNPASPSAAAAVAVDAAGNFVVVWDWTYPVFDTNIRGRLFAASGAPVGPDFLVDAGPVAALQPRVGRARAGSFVVAWTSQPLISQSEVMARRFDAAGTPLGGDVMVNAFTTGRQRNADVAVDADGDFVVAWESEGQDGSGFAVNGRRFSSTGIAGAEFQVNTYTTADQNYPAVAADPAGNFVVTWHTSLGAGVAAQRYAGGLMPASLLMVDATGNGNGVFEPMEAAIIAPSWLNANVGAAAFTGTVTSFTGPGAPGNPAYTIFDGAASYGTVASGATDNCLTASDCYRVRVDIPNPRPVVHWDATLREEIAPAALGAAKNWALHVGDSFADVPRTNPFYRFVETLLHHNVTGGCSAATYCPELPTTRAQMAVFVLVAKEGAGYAPDACLTPPFGDVPTTSPFCRWIAELARRGVVGGCGSGSYCPTDPVSRAEMAVFVLATREPGVTPPVCGPNPIFSDVPPTHPMCRWIEELARRGVVSGCGGGAYCPAAPVSREQMAVFLSVTFGLTLYGP